MLPERPQSSQMDRTHPAVRRMHRKMKRSARTAEHLRRHGFYVWQRRAIERRIGQLHAAGALPPTDIVISWPEQVPLGPLELRSPGGIPVARRGGFLHAPIVMRTFFDWQSESDDRRLRLEMSNRPSRWTRPWKEDDRHMQVSSFSMRSPRPREAAGVDDQVSLISFRPSVPLDHRWESLSVDVDGEPMTFELLGGNDDWLALGATRIFDIAISGHHVDRIGIQLVTR